MLHIFSLNIIHYRVASSTPGAGARASGSSESARLVERLLVAALRFLEPFLRAADPAASVRQLYKGVLRVFLVLLHDFPEFLCEHHAALCDALPPSCVQARNLVLSAFPRHMRLPDPFTPNLKVDLLPEIAQPPRVLCDAAGVLAAAPAPLGAPFKAELDACLQARPLPPSGGAQASNTPPPPPSPQQAQFLRELGARVWSGVMAAPQSGALTALVLYTGAQGIAQLQAAAKAAGGNTSAATALGASMGTSPAMDVFRALVHDAPTPEARYAVLNALANQLRFPNNHTHYFSCVLLFLFADAPHDVVREQLTRVLLERLIVHRPHPWGLLITFIELIKNPRYDFWSHSFTRGVPEIERLFESVARSCMTPVASVAAAAASTGNPSADDAGNPNSS